MTTQQRMRFEDLLAQPEDGYLYELVRGEILRMPPPKGKHGRIEMWLVRAIDRYLTSRALASGWSEDHGRIARDRLVGALAGGEFGIRFSLPDDPDQVRGLDVCYLSPEQVARYEATGEDEYFREVPTLVAEVISPSESADYVDEKLSDYLAGGARLVWLLYPRSRTVKVYSPDAPLQVVPFSGVLTGGVVLPDFLLAVATLFS